MLSLNDLDFIQKFNIRTCGKPKKKKKSRWLVIKKSLKLELIFIDPFNAPIYIRENNEIN